MNVLKDRIKDLIAINLDFEKEEKSLAYGSIFLESFNHSITNSTLKKHFDKDKWRKVCINLNDNKAGASFKSSELGGNSLNLEEIGTDAIRTSITQKIFTTDANVDYRQLEKAGMLLELTQDDHSLIGKKLYFEDQENKSTGFIDRKFGFEVNWVHLWLFNSGIALLTYKATLLEVTNTKSSENEELTLDHLALFNRCLRCTHDLATNALNFHFYHENESAQKVTVSKSYFFKDVIVDKWLSNNDKQKSGMQWLGIHDAATALYKRQYHHMQTLTWAHIDPRAKTQNSHETKKAELLWNMPYMWPEPSNGYSLDKIIDDLGAENWNTTMSSAHFAMMEGYPTTKDYVLHNFTATGIEASNLDVNNSWHINPEYLRNLFDSAHFEMYAEKDGLAMKDTLGIISNRTKEMQSDLAPKWINVYYPLYTLVMHLHFAIGRFETMSVGAYEQPEKHLQESNDFQRFRNNFWFHQYGNESETKLLVSKIKTSQALDERFEHLDSEMQEVSDAIMRRTQQAKLILAAFFLGAIYPFWNLLKASPLGTLFTSIFETNETLYYGALIVALLTVFLVGILFFRPIIKIFGKIWAKILTISFDGSK